MDHSSNTMTLLLPVSKNDPEARGCSRSWPCVCDDDDEAYFEGCPYHVTRDHLEFLAQKFGDPAEHDDDERPLFPDP